MAGLAPLVTRCVSETMQVYASRTELRTDKQMYFLTYLLACLETPAETTIQLVARRRDLFEATTVHNAIIEQEAKDRELRDLLRGRIIQETSRIDDEELDLADLKRRVDHRRMIITCQAVAHRSAPPGPPQVGARLRRQLQHLDYLDTCLEEFERALFTSHQEIWKLRRLLVRFQQTLHKTTAERIRAGDMLDICRLKLGNTSGMLG